MITLRTTVEKTLLFLLTTTLFFGCQIDRDNSLSKIVSVGESDEVLQINDRGQGFIGGEEVTISSTVEDPKNQSLATEYGLGPQSSVHYVTAGRCKSNWNCDNYCAYLWYGHIGGSKIGCWPDNHSDRKTTACSCY